jgi:hypothetical protein
MCYLTCYVHYAHPLALSSLVHRLLSNCFPPQPSGVAGYRQWAAGGGCEGGYGSGLGATGAQAVSTLEELNRNCVKAVDGEGAFPPSYAESGGSASSSSPVSVLEADLLLHLSHQLLHPPDPLACTLLVLLT